MTRESVSACLIVRNEAERIGDALASVAFCDEIVVVDGGSTDETVEIARAAGARVIENPWPGFGAQRNVALDHASSEWVIEIDADERVSPELRDEIEAFLASPPPGIDMGALPIRNVFLGAPIAASARYPGYRNRLFRRAAYRHDERRSVHEGLWANGPAHPFSGDLMHLLAGTLREALGDAATYARLEARQVAVARTPLVLAKGVVARPAAKFVYRTFVLAGWRDGWRGLVKIGLDCWTDAAVVLLAATKGAGAGRGDGGHWGAVSAAPAQGPVRIVAVATAPELEQATAWLVEAAAAGADVAVVSDGAPRSPAIRLRPLERPSARHLIRALDAESQVRRYDALVLGGPASRRLVRLVPANLLGRVPPLTLDDAPPEAVEDLTARTRQSS